MKIEVRPLRDTDIEELSRIEAASFSMPWSAEDFRGLLLRDYCLYVVAETDGHIAGCAGLTDSFHEGNIERHRSTGIWEWEAKCSKNFCDWGQSVALRHILWKSE